jgi:hypothetical protein
MTEEKVYKTQTHDTDDTMMYVGTSNLRALLDHSYAKLGDNNHSNISLDVKSSVLPAEVAAILPHAYKYNIVKMERMFYWFA